MGHTLHAVISNRAVIGAMQDKYAVYAVKLPQDFCLVPLTTDVKKLIRSQYERLSLYFQELSHIAPIVEIDTDYFGGGGEQTAVLWDKGILVYTNTASTGPINESLKHMGVHRENGQDEFDMLGLRHYRDTYEFELDQGR